MHICINGRIDACMCQGSGSSPPDTRVWGKKKVKCFNTKPILLKLICFVEEALCFGQLRPATQLPHPPNPPPPSSEEAEGAAISCLLSSVFAAAGPDMAA